jgi:type II secretory ATPase GspE/PulE/Tfp pilus assembly ATPase PilB-like protein
VAGGELNIAIADPLNRPAIEAIELMTGLRVSVSVALQREIRDMLDEQYGPAQLDSLGFSSTAFSAKVLKSINDDLSGGKLLDCLLISILKNRLSSLSLQPFSDRVMISGRRNGAVRELGNLSLTHYPAVVRKVRLCASIGREDGLSSSGSFAFAYRSRKLTFLAAMLQGPGGDYVTLRLQASSHIPERLADLDAPSGQRAAFGRLARAERGITFFAARSVQERCRFMDLMLEEAATGAKNVIILGNGPGRMQKRFPRIPLPPSAADRARLIMDSLDHDPDILVIEDATEGLPFSAACRAAMRGKLVLAGLDIRGTRNALNHLLLFQQNNTFLPIFVNGLISFKGILTLCPACRSEYVPPREEMTVMRLEKEPPAFYRAAGCDVCGHSGFRERRFLLDVLAFDDEFIRVFEQTADVAAMELYLAMKGYHGSMEEGLRLLKAGEVSPEEYIASVVM